MQCQYIINATLGNYSEVSCDCIAWFGCAFEAIANPLTVAEWMNVLWVNPLSV